MMIEGYKRTLNDKDLLELPSENRAKNVLSSYRKVKTPSMTWSILKAFQWPLFKMFLYSMVWSGNVLIGIILGALLMVFIQWVSLDLRCS